MDIHRRCPQAILPVCRTSFRARRDPSYGHTNNGQVAPIIQRRKSRNRKSTFTKRSTGTRPIPDEGSQTVNYFSLALAAFLLACGTSQTANDTLVFVRGSDSVGLDPALETDGESFKVCDNIYETLVTYDEETTEVIPQLAHAWNVSDDMLTWTFHLRTDVQFHDGTPFNAQAMLFSLGRQFFKDHPYHDVPGAYKYWKDMDMDNIVSDMSAPNDSTFVFQLKRANAPFLSNLAMNFCAAVSPTAVKKYGSDFFKHPVGTGPFRFVEWRKDERILLDRNENYWSRPAPLKRLIFKPVQESSVRFLELKQGTAQGMDNLNPEYIEQIRNNPDLQLLTQPGMNVGYLSHEYGQVTF